MRIGVSRCLLGVRCRYDGRSKPCAVLASELGKYAKVVDVCPELDCGLGCPRVAVDLYDCAGDGIRMISKEGVDVTGRMRKWLEKIMPSLRNLDGFILKARSPSCGLGNTCLRSEGNGYVDGLFTAALKKAYPKLPLVDESRFTDAESVASFVSELKGKSLLRRVESGVRELLSNSPACHDWDHTLRVYNNARRIMSMLEPDQEFDELMVAVASLMHDIGRSKELQDEGKTNHAAYGAELAPGLLRKWGADDERWIQNVADCIRSHRFRKRDGNQSPNTLEAKIVFDADKLDSIGAIGIGRSFHFAGRVGARVHNTESEALNSKSYSVNDSAYREYLVKLRNVHQRMLTEPGRKLAEKRHEFMVGFFDVLNQETED
ncbi:MAG: DUF523 domain-containing protein [Lentisphaerae bacterium]|jgi:uncharacterized protein|nr:DUF523 domain-containing protein [Lentisphaerota bacterium]